jgi:hypothetical protein
MRPAEVSPVAFLALRCRVPNRFAMQYNLLLAFGTDALTVPVSHLKAARDFCSVSKWLNISDGISDGKAYEASKVRVRMPRHTTRPNMAMCDEKAGQN